MNILVFLFVLQLGYAPTGVPTMFDAPGVDDRAMYTDFKAEFVLLNFFFVGGYAKTYFTFSDMHGYPFEAYYGFSAGFRFGNGLELGWKHVCMHPIVTSLYAPSMGESYNEIYLKFSGSFTLIGGDK